MRALALAAALLPAALAGQSPRAAPWRFGVEVNAPARLLEVNEIAFPDSNDGRIDLGIGFAAVAERRWRLANPLVYWGVVARLASVPVKGTLGGATYNPGRALILDAGLRVGRQILVRSEIFAGAGMSHWSGPDDTAPFSGAGSLLFSFETGWTQQLGTSPWRASANIHVTRFGEDPDRAVSTGIVWRGFLGITRDY